MEEPNYKIIDECKDLYVVCDECEHKLTIENLWFECKQCGTEYYIFEEDKELKLHILSNNEIKSLNNCILQ